MFCTQCGHDNTAGAQFCIQCGAKLQQQEWATPPQAPAEAPGDGAFRFEPRPRRKNGPGIASFILAMFNIVLWLVVVIFSAIMAGQVMNEEDPVVMLMGLLVIVAFITTITGLILGIIGSALGNRRKGMAITGLIINILLLVGVVFLIIMGVAMA